jgi:hypothetical protein
MPRRGRTADKPVVIPSTSLVASSVRYPGKAARIYVQKQDWQRECYRHYAICGEARFSARFFGNAVSRALLQPATIGDDGKPVVEDSGPVKEALDALFNGRDGQVEMLDAIGIHLTVAGECYLVGRTVQGGDIWEILSTLEIQVAGDKWQINYGDGLPAIDLTENDVVIRIWLPNPSKRIEADSPFKALLPILSEIEWLTRHVFSQISSRLAGAGILFLPQGMTFPPPPESTDNTVPGNDADAFMATLAEAMMTPIAEPGSASAVVPIVVTAPDDVIDRAKLLTFWSELDEASMSLRSEAIHRFALGMDLPPEQVLGMSSNPGTGGGTTNGISHWGAWQIEESTIKLHVEPMLDTICNALVMGYLRPALPDVPGASITYDITALRLRPDRSKEALELYDRCLITGEAVRRENGFAETDAPSDAERRLWLLMKVVSTSATPEQVGAALQILGVDVSAAPPPVQQKQRDTPTPPLLDQHPTRPRTPAESALVAAAEGLVFRALERAGNRLRSAGSRPPNVPSYETHCYAKANGNAARLLDDAWSCAPRVLDGIADPSTVIPLLDSYCRSLLTEGVPHDRERLRSWLELTEARP